MKYYYLTEKQYDSLMTYKHFAEKTPYEKFMLENFTSHIEKRLPGWWSPNLITYVGNVSLFIALAVTFYFGGVNYENSEVP